MRSFGTYAFVGLTVVVSALTPAGLQGQEDPERDTLPIFDLEPLTVIGRVDDLTGLASTASVGYVGFRDLNRRPIVREGELLETVPGMILTQHSGSGKSNQMFVRGFNLDHGTDFATRVEGMPVNIPTHAHGQGYTDLNFLIPELVDNIEYSLGNYYADIGDFGSAGGAEIQLRRDLERPMFLLGAGEFGHQRMLAAGALKIGSGGTLLAGGELRGYDGPWDLPEEVQKVSGLLRYTHEGESSRFSVLAMGYDNSWQSSDQIPLRAVQSGTISRFGQIDETLGGESSRFSLAASWTRSGEASSQRIEAYGIRYGLDLFSNFTYLLDNPNIGDQLRQNDDARLTYGASFAHQQLMGWASREHRLTVGAEFRGDQADVTLSRTRERSTLSIVRSDDVSQLSSGAYAELVSPWTERFSTTIGLRGDVYRFDVASDRPENTGVESDAILSPKLSMAFRPTDDVEVYLAGGFGFHSNDARGTVTTIDPASSEVADPVDPLVQSRGAEFGLRATPVDGLRSTATLWTVDLDSELLFVGDAGNTEASDPSRRVGVTFANFYRVNAQWNADLDVSFTRARFREADEGADRIPGALENVVALGISRDPLEDGVFGAIRLRRFGTYALIEDNSQRANANALVNMQVGYRFGNTRISLSMFNMFDEEHSDIQYFYPSRLAGEPAGGVEDLHFHPAEPRALRVNVSWGM